MLKNSQAEKTVQVTLIESIYNKIQSFTTFDRCKIIWASCNIYEMCSKAESKRVFVSYKYQPRLKNNLTYETSDL